MEKELQKKYVELQMIEQQSQQIQEQTQQINQQMMELESVKESIEELKKVNVGTGILVPISGGLFIKAKLEDNKNLLVNVGAGTTVQKEIPEAKKMIDEQIIEMEKIKKQGMDNLNQNARKFNELQEELTKLLENKNV